MSYSPLHDAVGATETKDDVATPGLQMSTLYVAPAAAPGAGGASSRKWTCQQVLSNAANPLGLARLSADGQHLVFVEVMDSGNCCCHVISLTSPATHKKIEIQDQKIWDVVLSETGMYLLLVLVDGVQCYNLSADGEQLMKHPHNVWENWKQSDLSNMFSDCPLSFANVDEKISGWEISAEHLITAFCVTSTGVTIVALADKDRRGLIQVYSPKASADHPRPLRLQSFATCLQVAASYLAAGCGDGLTYVWHIGGWPSSSVLLHKLGDKRGAYSGQEHILDVCMSPEEDRIFTIDAHTIRAWDLRVGVLVDSFVYEEAPLLALCYHPVHYQLLAADKRGHLLCWSLLPHGQSQSSQKDYEMPPIRSIYLDAKHGNYFLAIDKDSVLRLFCAHSCRELCKNTDIQHCSVTDIATDLALNHVIIIYGSLSNQTVSFWTINLDQSDGHYGIYRLKSDLKIPNQKPKCCLAGECFAVITGDGAIHRYHYTWRDAEPTHHDSFSLSGTSIKPLSWNLQEGANSSILYVVGVRNEKLGWCKCQRNSQESSPTWFDLNISWNDGMIYCAMVSNSALKLAVYSPGRKCLELWDVHGNQVINSIEVDNADHGLLRFSPDGQFLLAGGSTCRDQLAVPVLTIYDQQLNVMKTLIEDCTSTVKSVSCSRDNHSLLVWYNNDEFVVYRNVVFQNFQRMDVKAMAPSLVDIAEMALFSNQIGFFNLPDDTIERYLLQGTTKPLPPLQSPGQRKDFPEGQNLLHYAVVKDHSEFLARALRHVPFAVWMKYTGTRCTKNGHFQLETMTLLSRALAYSHSGCVAVILDVLVELLTVPQRDEIRHYVSQTKNDAFLPYRYQSNDADQDQLQHGFELVDIHELCQVAESFPVVFLKFVARLRLVPNYKVMVGEGVLPLRVSMMIAGSEERCPRNEQNTSSEKNASFWGKSFENHQATPDQVSGYIIPLPWIAGFESTFLAMVTGCARQRHYYHIFNSEVIQILVQFKWQQLVANLFYLDVFLHSLWSLLFVIHALAFEDYVSVYRKQYLAVGCLLYIGLWSLTLYFTAREGLQMYRNWSTASLLAKYFMDGWNALDIATYLCVIASLLFQLVLMANASPSSPSTTFISINNFCALIIPLLAGKSLFYLQGMPRSAALVRMILRIIWATWNFTYILIVIIAAFAASFVLIFKHAHLPGDDDNSGDEDVYYYQHYGQTLMTVYTFLFGNFSLQDLSRVPSPGIAMFLLAIYLFIVVIILLNLLIAIMGDKYDEVQQNLMAEVTYGRARLILEYEELVPERYKLQHRQNFFPKYLQILKKGTTWHFLQKRPTLDMFRGLGGGNGLNDDEEDEEDEEYIWRGRMKVIQDVIDQQHQHLYHRLQRGNVPTKIQEMELQWKQNLDMMKQQVEKVMLFGNQLEKVVDIVLQQQQQTMEN